MSSLCHLQPVIKKFSFLPRVYCDDLKIGFSPKMVKSQSSKQYSTVTLHNVKKATIRCHLLLYYLRFVSDAYISKYVIYYF